MEQGDADGNEDDAVGDEREADRDEGESEIHNATVKGMKPMLTAMKLILQPGNAML